MASTSTESRIKSDHAVRSAAKDFFEAARLARSTTSAAAIELMKRGGWRVQFGNVYDVTIVRDPLSNLVVAALKVLGPEAGNEKEIADTAWVCIDVNRDVNDDIKNFLDDLASRSLRTIRFIAPCYSVRLADKVSQLELGPVAVRRTQDVASAINKPDGQFNLSTESPQSIKEPASGGKTQVPLTEICWDVEARVSANNIDIEALWLIYVMLSILRIVAEGDCHDSLAPALGEIESTPTSKPETENHSFLIQDNAYYFGGGKVAPHYTVSDSIVAKLINPDLANKINLIFDPPRGSLAERFQKGLGWMTRGRIVYDSTERLLFFFTALEALLSDNDKNAPVVQNIARRGSVIITNDIEKRIEFAKELSSLYGTRSDFVHRGHRSAHQHNARRVQEFSEAIFGRLLTEHDLSVQINDFHSSLTNAGYGLPWP